MSFNSTLVEAAKAVLARAKAGGLGIVTAESCTSGLLASVLSEAPGAFRYPMQDDLLAWQGELREVCEREFRPLCGARVFGQRVTAYVRPAGRVTR